MNNPKNYNVEQLLEIINNQQQQIDMYQKLLKKKPTTTTIIGSFTITAEEIIRLSTPNIEKFSFTKADINVSYRKKSNGLLEARMTRKGIQLQVMEKTKAKLKSSFLKALDEALTQKEIDDAMVTPKNAPLFMDYAYKWLAIKKRTVKQSTYEHYDRHVDHILYNRFVDRTVTSIKREELQAFLFEYVDRNKLTTARKLHLTLKCIFDLIEDDLRYPSPMKKVVIPRSQTKHGKAFTYEEEQKLVNYCITHLDKAVSHAWLLQIYLGLRRSELKTLKQIDDNWFSAITSKQRMGKDEEIRYIPITPMLSRVLSYIDLDAAKNCNPNILTARIHSIFPNHHDHELRTTFITRCKESGVNLELVMLWDGHCQDIDVRSSVVDRGYTDYSKEFQLKQSKLVDYQQWDLPMPVYVSTY